VIGNGQRLVERQQMYENTGTGLQKIANERMLNDRGRKVVRERQGDNVNSFDHYRNMRQEQASDFDQEWEAMAHQMGFGSGNRLGYGEDPYQARSYQQRPMIFPNEDFRRARPQNDLMPT
jgi:hypothetical protein